MEGYIFSYDIEKDMLHFSVELQQELLLEDTEVKSATSMLLQKVHTDDYDQMLEKIRPVMFGRENFVSFQARVLIGQNEYENFKWNCVGLLWKNNKPCQLVFVLNQVEEHVQYSNAVVLSDELFARVEDALEGKNRALILTFYIDRLHSIEEKYGLEACERVQDIMKKCISQYADKHGDCIITYDNASVLIRFDYQEKDEQAIFKSIKQRIELEIIEMKDPIFFTISAGADYIRTELDEVKAVKDHMHFALEEACRKGRNRLVVYQSKQYERFLRKSDILNVMTRCIQEDFKGFELFYQPIVHASDGKLAGAEALLRWKNDTFGMLSPFEFIPILEESGLIIPAGRWILETALRQCKEWQGYVPDFTININISYVQMEHSNVLKDIVKLVEKYELRPETAKMEITESGVVESNEHLRELICQFSEYRIPIALDDFGTGYSNIRYLKDIQPAIIKLDRSFIIQALKDAYTQTVIRHITLLAHEADIKVVFEGVETQEDQDKLMVLEPDYIQGYLYGKPVSAKDFYEQHIATYKK